MSLAGPGAAWHSCSPTKFTFRAAALHARRLQRKTHSDMRHIHASLSMLLRSMGPATICRVELPRPSGTPALLDTMRFPWFTCARNFPARGLSHAYSTSLAVAVAVSVVLRPRSCAMWARKLRRCYGRRAFHRIRRISSISTVRTSPPAFNRARWLFMSCRPIVGSS